MIEIIKSSLQDFYASYKKYLTFALLYLFFTSFIFVPFISYIFNRMLKIIGTGSLLNAEVYKIALSPPGMIGLIIISLLAVIILFIEIGVMIMIAQQTYFSRNILVSEAFITTGRKLPILLEFGTIQLLILFWLVVPFLDTSAFPALLDFNLPIFLTNQFYGSSNIAITLYLVIVLVVIFLFVRFIFTLHFIFIEEKSIWAAMISSWRMTQKKKFKIVISLCILNILFFVIGFLFLNLLSNIPSVTDTFFVGELINTYLVTFSSIMTLVFSLLFIPLNIIIITRLFFRFKKNQGEKVENDLIVHGWGKLNSLENRVTQFFQKGRYRIVAVIIVYVTSMFLINYTVSDNIVYLKWNVQVAAHRGTVNLAPENSLSSIQTAIEKGVDAIEIDAMLTEDGVIVLNHDLTLQRVAGIPSRVEDMTYSEVSKVDIGRKFSEEFIGERIPTLDDALRQVKDENITVIIDVKGVDSSRNEEIAQGIVRLVEKYEMVEKVYVQAFDYNVLQEVRNRNSEIKVGQILYLSAGNLANLNVDFYTIRQTMLSERFIENARKQNREVWVWTVNINRNIREVLKYDINGIITDYPERVQSVIGIDFAQEEDF